MLDDDRTPEVGLSTDLASLARWDLNVLVSLYALLEEANVTRAAARVGLSQPAMSHVLKRCRRMLGDELLVRIGAKSELTWRGRELLASLAQVLQSVQAVLDPGAVFDPARSNRLITISTATGTATTVLPPLMRRLDVVAPNMRLRLPRSLLAFEDLMERPDIDLAILPDWVPMIYPRVRLYEDEWVAIVDAGNSRVGERLTVENLTTLEHVMYRADNLLRPYRTMEAAGITWTSRVVIHDFLSIPFLLEGTDRISIMQRRLAESPRFRDVIRVLPLPIEVEPLRMDLVWNPRLGHDPMRPWLTALLKDLFVTGEASDFP